MTPPTNISSLRTRIRQSRQGGDLCFVCGQEIPNGAGLYHAGFGVRVHLRDGVRPPAPSRGAGLLDIKAGAVAAQAPDSGSGHVAGGGDLPVFDVRVPDAERGAVTGSGGRGPVRPRRLEVAVDCDLGDLVCTVRGDRNATSATSNEVVRRKRAT